MCSKVYYVSHNYRNVGWQRHNLYPYLWQSINMELKHLQYSMTEGVISGTLSIFMITALDSNICFWCVLRPVPYAEPAVPYGGG